jgi:L-iditol 2-dehydrogenase
VVQKRLTGSANANRRTTSVSTGKIKAAVLHGIGDIRIDHVPMPAVEHDHDVLIKMAAVGVCGSDVHYYTHGRIGSFVVENPLILGHECAGVVVEVGSGVADLKPGDRVALEPGVPCGTCRLCRIGRYNLCRDVVFLGTPPVNGAFVEYLVHHARFTYKLPETMSLQEGAMLEPLAVGMHAAARGDVRAGDSIAILGSGPIGLMTLQAARAYGASVSIAIDLMENRLELARKLGATYTINAAKEDVVETIREITNGEGVDIAFETAGTGATVALTVDVVRRGGTVVLVGLGAQDVVPLNVIKMVIEEIRIVPIHRYANVYERAIPIVAEGKVDLKSMITGTRPLARVEEALNLPRTEPESTIKTVVTIPE